MPTSRQLAWSGWLSSLILDLNQMLIAVCVAGKRVQQRLAEYGGKQYTLHHTTNVYETLTTQVLQIC